MTAVTPAILSALAEGVTAITPNRRLARQLLRDFDRAQLASGRRTWPTASVLPYATWIEILWQQHADAVDDTAAGTLLTQAQSSHLWRGIVDAGQPILLDPGGAARLAGDAWRLVHAWGAGGASWRAWRQEDADVDDPAIFAAWAESYARELRRSGAVDAAQLPDLLAQGARHLDCGSLRTIFVGFLEHTPQQQRLHAALIAAGADIRFAQSLPARPPTAMRVTAANSRDELVTALSWARDRALATPHSRIGIVIENLGEWRDEVVLLADEVLCPELAMAASLTTCRPYEVSLGTALAETPLVASALELIALAEGKVAAGDAAALLRSPYLCASGSEWSRRAPIERDWLEAGQSEVTLVDAIVAAERHAPELAARWQRARGALNKGASASPRAWADTWRAWLVEAGWLGSLKLDSVEYQAREAWESVVGDFVRLGAVAPRLARIDALRTLRTMTQERIFQAEGTDAPIQLLGVLEGAGLDFDALWVAGLSADRWPPAPAPNPLLPLHWQRERNVPRSSPENELVHARALTGLFAAAAPVVVFSSPGTADDLPRAPSTLLLDYPELAMPTQSPQTWTHAIAGSRLIESSQDDRAPPLAPGATAPGGTGIVAAQSDCPFKAVARHRLSVDTWPQAPSGLSPQERGKLLHATMATFWNALRDQATLAALEPSARHRHIEAAVAVALGQLPPARWRVLPAVVRGGEAQRIAMLLDAWLSVELDRPSFSVTGTEISAALELEQLRFRLRIDRVDALEDGGSIIVDYKSGSGERPTSWFDERPRASQLGMYALAERAAQPDTPVRAIAFAQFKPEDIAAIGLTADSGAWPALTQFSKLGRFRNWGAMESWWRTQLGALACEIAGGWAAVTPRKSPSPCRQCKLQSLCRIDSVEIVDDEDREDD